MPTDLQTIGPDTDPAKASENTLIPRAGAEESRLRRRTRRHHRRASTIGQWRQRPRRTRGRGRRRLPGGTPAAKPPTGPSHGRRPVGPAYGYLSGGFTPCLSTPGSGPDGLVRTTAPAPAVQTVEKPRRPGASDVGAASRPAAGARKRQKGDAEERG
ncbi:MAG: hypothetical protein MZV70_19015 [Desulfobacterales bacterium]|nr:hypothetical protein [Desulfobacterales bacterium]